MKRKENWKIFLLTFFNSSLQVFQFLKTPKIFHSYTTKSIWEILQIIHAFK